MLTSSRYARAVVCKFFLCIHASYFMPKYDEVNFEEIRRGEIRNWAEKHIFISSKHFDKSRACAVMHAYLHMYILWLAEKVSPSQEGIFIHIYLREIPTLKRTKHTKTQTHKKQGHAKTCVQTRQERHTKRISAQQKEGKRHTHTHKGYIRSQKYMGTHRNTDVYVKEIRTHKIIIDSQETD